MLPLFLGAWPSPPAGTEKAVSGSSRNSLPGLEIFGMDGVHTLQTFMCSDAYGEHISCGLPGGAMAPGRGTTYRRLHLCAQQFQAAETPDLCRTPFSLLKYGAELSAREYFEETREVKKH